MGAYVIGADEGEAYWFLDNLMTVKASSDLTGNRGFALLEAVMPPGSAPPPHIHERDDEAWYVLEGEVEFNVVGQIFTADSGSFVFAPKGEEHGFRVTSSTPLKVLAMSWPAGFADFVQELGEPAVARTLPPEPKIDPERIVAVGQKHGIRVVPPG